MGGAPSAAQRKRVRAKRPAAAVPPQAEEDDAAETQDPFALDWE
jgi:hypothetical protein